MFHSKLHISPFIKNKKFYLDQWTTQFIKTEKMHTYSVENQIIQLHVIVFITGIGNLFIKNKQHDKIAHHC